MNITKEQVSSLLAKAPMTQTKHKPYPSAKEEYFEQFMVEYGFSIPSTLADYLRISNGAWIYPNGVYGIYTEDERLDIRKMFEYFPEWLERKWIPISSDGCGCYNVMDAGYNQTEHQPIFFIDCSDYVKPDYIVASNMWTYIYFHIEQELRDEENPPPEFPHMSEPSLWPFNKEYVLSVDPDIEKITAYPIPWEVD